MGVSIKGRGAVSKNTGTGPSTGNGPPTGPRRGTSSRPSRGGILGATAQREILRKAGSSDMTMKEVRVSAAKGGLVELKITGWDKSKASGNADKGASSLVQWLEKKGSTKLGSRNRTLKIRKVCCRQHADLQAWRCQHVYISGPLSFASQVQNDDRELGRLPTLPYG